MSIAAATLDLCRGAIARLDAGAPWSAIMPSLRPVVLEHWLLWECYAPRDDAHLGPATCLDCGGLPQSVCPAFVRHIVTESNRAAQVTGRPLDRGGDGARSSTITKGA